MKRELLFIKYNIPRSVFDENFDPEFQEKLGLEFWIKLSLAKDAPEEDFVRIMDIQSNDIRLALNFSHAQLETDEAAIKKHLQSRGNNFNFLIILL